MPNSWRSTWKDLSVCYCLWQAGQKKINDSLWNRLLANPDTLQSASIGQPEDGNSGLKDLINCVVGYDWCAKNPNVKVFVRAWPTLKKSGEVKSDGDTDLVLAAEGLYLMLRETPSSRGLYGNVARVTRFADSNGKARFSVGAVTEDGADPESDSVTIDVDILTLKPSCHLEMWPYMMQVDNETLRGSKDFRQAVRKIARNDQTSEGKGRAIKEKINQIAGIDFHKGRPNIKYRVRLGGNTPESTIEYDRTGFTVEIVIPEEEPRSTERGDEKRAKARTVNDWPCGILEDP